MTTAIGVPVLLMLGGFFGFMIGRLKPSTPKAADRCQHRSLKFDGVTTWRKDYVDSLGAATFCTACGEGKAFNLPLPKYDTFYRDAATYRSEEERIIAVMQAKGYAWDPEERTFLGP